MCFSLGAGIESEVANNLLVYTNPQVGLSATKIEMFLLLGLMVVLAIASNKKLFSLQSFYTLLKYSRLNISSLITPKAGFVKCYITDKAGFRRGKIRIFLIIPPGLPGIK